MRTEEDMTNMADSGQAGTTFPNDADMPVSRREAAIAGVVRAAVRAAAMVDWPQGLSGAQKVMRESAKD